jgi:penicillin-binding protein 2
MNSRQVPILVVFIIGSLILSYKLIQLQILDDKYKKLAEKTILDKQTIYPSRGLIYDRNGKLLTYNKPIYDIEAIYRNVDQDMDTSLFCSLLGIDNKTFNENLNKNWKDRRYHKSLPYTFLSKVDQQKFSRFQEQLFRFPGFYPVIRNIRAYPHQSASHILGYLNEVGSEELKKEDTPYSSGDYIGIKGIEKQYENKLRGNKGVKFLLRDNVGREVSSFDKGNLDSLATQGTDIVTSIDLDLQEYSESLMTNKRGSVVVLDPKNGEILTMLSAPFYDPNLLNLDVNRSQAFIDLTADSEQKPLLDRSLSARYPPGSIFKPILSLIALQEDVVAANQTVSCNGDYHYRTFSYGCHDHPTPYNVQIALEHSCNSYFFSMVRKLIEKEGFDNPAAGLNILKSHLYDFGLGSPLGVDLNNEVGGFVPSPEYYNGLYKKQKVDWKSTYIMSIGIGQGELQLTTLQMANLAAIIGNRGYYYTPHLITEFSNGDNIDAKYLAPKRVKIDDVHFDPVIDGMRRVISSGTGYLAKVPGINVCGKTGTSQNPHGKDHSVFFAFAPEEDPQIAIAVYIENAGFGGDIAAPIAGLIIEKYLKGEITRPQLEERIKNMNLIDTNL